MVEVSVPYLSSIGVLMSVMELIEESSTWILHISRLSICNIVLSALFCICSVRWPSFRFSPFVMWCSGAEVTVSSISCTTVVIMQDCRSINDRSNRQVCIMVWQLVSVGMDLEKVLIGVYVQVLRIGSIRCFFC